jgi:hypothetical protein
VEVVSKSTRRVGCLGLFSRVNTNIPGERACTSPLSLELSLVAFHVFCLLSLLRFFLLSHVRKQPPPNLRLLGSLTASSLVSSIAVTGASFSSLGLGSSTSTSSVAIEESWGCGSTSGGCTSSCGDCTRKFVRVSGETDCLSVSFSY